MERLIVSIDQGTTGTRVAIYSESGDLVSYSYREHAQFYPRPGWVEHDPLEIWGNTLKAMRDALSGIDVKNIAAIGVTNQRETTVVWDPSTGRPLYNAIVWQDRRTAPLVDRLREEHLDLIYSRTGLYPDPYFSSTKLWWLLDNVEGLREKALRGEAIFGTIDSWLIWNLTRGSTDTVTPDRGGAHVTDYSNASRTMMFNIRRLDWDAELLEIQGGIPCEMLPLALPSSHIYGYTGPEVSRDLFEGRSIPVSGDAGDQQAALFGQACFGEGQVKCTYGTGNFVLMNIGDSTVESRHRLLCTVFYSLRRGEAVYALEGSIFVAGAAIQWLRDGLKIIEVSPEINPLAESVDSTEGVYVVPAFVGLGAPYWDMYARGLIIGITRGTRRAHIARATLEAIAYLTRDVVEAMEADTGLRIRELKADGGASKSDFLVQFQADILNVKVVRPRILETTSLGACFLAGLAVDVWKGLDEVASMWKAEKVFTPRMREEEREKLYKGWRKAVERALGWAREVPWFYGY